MKTKKSLNSEKFFDLLRGRNDKNRVSLDREFNAECRAELTVVCCDSADFSRRVQQYGTIEFLDNLTKCHDAMKLICARHGGETLSDRAGSLALLFPEPQKAVACVVEMLRWLRKRNKDLPEMKRYEVRVAVHHGELLRLTDDAYGPAVNAAFRLASEAGRGELLVTGAVNAVICGLFEAEYDRNVTVGAEEFDVYKVNCK